MSDWEIVYRLPGPDALEIKMQGYEQGLDEIQDLLLLPADGLDIVIPRAATLQTLAERSADAFMLGAEELRITNRPDLMRMYYIAAFKAGYSFGLYACMHGFLRTLYEMPSSSRYDLMSRFAFERVFHVDAPEIDAVLLPALAELDALHEQYHALY